MTSGNNAIKSTEGIKCTVTNGNDNLIIVGTIVYVPDKGDG